ncbi:LPS translocon maturation chaperone LptM [Parasphingorhabdus sp.]|uniref:LPS translocon maturation chaperone LptM n=1 Tax=Parasphingorhabdus sp. TaxID=2709688 RepID=UPI003001ED70
MKKAHSILLLATASLVLAACGNRGALEPAKGEVLPAAVYGEMKTPSGDELLVPSSQARPERSDELLRRSEKRQNDEFDLPPPG